MAAEVDFDTLVAALQEIVLGAQEAVRRRHEAHLRRLAEAGPSGIAFTAQIPSDQTDAERYETFAISTQSLMGRGPPRIAELSLEFDCELQEAVQPAQPGSSRVVMSLKPRRRAAESALHRVKILLTGPGPLSGSVTVDGVVLRDIEPIHERRTASDERSARANG